MVSKAEKEGRLMEASRLPCRLRRFGKAAGKPPAGLLPVRGGISMTGLAFRSLTVLEVNWEQPGEVGPKQDIISESPVTDQCGWRSARAPGPPQTPSIIQS